MGTKVRLGNAHLLPVYTEKRPQLKREQLKKRVENDEHSTQSGFGSLSVTLNSLLVVLLNASHV